MIILKIRARSASRLRAVPCGGSAVPPSLLERFDRLGITVVQAWGMTETAPLATVSQPASRMDGWSEEDVRAVRAKQGRALHGVEHIFVRIHFHSEVVKMGRLIFFLAMNAQGDVPFFSHGAFPNWGGCSTGGKRGAGSLWWRRAW